MNKNKIMASILSADFARLGEEITAVLDAGADAIHFDVMDNHYVPNLTIGPLVCEALRDHGITALIDVHLMTKPVDSLVVPFAKAGAECITFHAEATEHVERTIQLIHDNGCKAGLAFNPETSLAQLESVIDKLELILIMAVNPGFSGQKFISDVLPKIQDAHNLIDNRNIELAVDGGINSDTVKEVAAHGATSFICGSAIFKAADYAKAISAIRFAAQN